MNTKLDSATIAASQIIAQDAARRRYLAAPRWVKRIGHSLVQSDTGVLFPIGFTPAHVRPSAQKLGLDTSEQAAFAGVVVDAARAITVMPHLQYRKPGQAHIIGTMPMQYFDRLGKFAFVCKPNVWPSDAIRTILEEQDKPFITECSIIIQLMLYKAALDYMGEPAFNKRFSPADILFKNITIGHSPFLGMVDMFNIDAKTILKRPSEAMHNVMPGDILYLTNIEPYTHRHIHGESPGLNVVYLGLNGFGKADFASLFTIKRTRTYDEMVDLLVEDYNKIPHGQWW